MNDGGPAFSYIEHGRYSNGEPYTKEHPGLSLRDYFAAAALTGMLADTESTGSKTGIAQHAYQYADAMLAERDKKGDGK